MLNWHGARGTRHGRGIDRGRGGARGGGQRGRDRHVRGGGNVAREINNWRKARNFKQKLNILMKEKQVEEEGEEKKEEEFNKKEEEDGSSNVSDGGSTEESSGEGEEMETASEDELSSLSLLILPQLSSRRKRF